ncbi:MAG: hypothetical protein ACO3BH_09955, partial [Quisquiliibacterium sp.]
MDEPFWRRVAPLVRGVVESRVFGVRRILSSASRRPCVAKLRVPDLRVPFARACEFLMTSTTSADTVRQRYLSGLALAALGSV